MKKISTLILAVGLMTACVQKPQKALILYYSQEGTTEKAALEIQRLTGADIESFDVEEAYDGNFDETVQRCLRERREGFVPTLKTLKSDLSQYEVIYLGYPVWFGTYAPPVKALLSSVKIEGKTIIPFCSFGSGGLTASVSDLKAVLTQCNILQGYGVRTARIQSAPEEIKRFLIEQGHIEGTVEPLGTFSLKMPVTEAEVAIFNEACSGYQFPLGTPISFRKRTTPYGTDYRFATQSEDAGGHPVVSNVYVTVRSGQAAEFTLVER